MSLIWNNPKIRINKIINPSLLALIRIIKMRRRLLAWNIMAPISKKANSQKVGLKEGLAKKNANRQSPKSNCS